VSNIRAIEAGVFVGGQIALEDVAALAAAGVRTIVNNRPDGEEPWQPTGAGIAAAAHAAGVAYVAAPIAGGIAPQAIDAMRVALAAHGDVLAYCKSGMRSAALWAIVRAGEGADVDALIAAARGAGVELGGLRAMLTNARGGRV
jgi:uncharacterized protein (TIGR01244 family)